MACERGVGCGRACFLRSPSSRGEAYNDGMRIFLAGASGVIGQRLIPRLVQAGHVVGGLTRSPSKTELRATSVPNRFFVMSSTGRHLSGRFVTSNRTSC